MLGHRLRRWPNIKKASSQQLAYTGCKSWLVLVRGSPTGHTTDKTSPTRQNPRRWPNVVLMLAQRRGRLSNIKTASGGRLLR